MSRRRGVVVLLLAVIAESGLCYDENDGLAASKNALDAKFHESNYAELPSLPNKLPFPGQFSNGIGDHSGLNRKCLQWYWVPLVSWGSCTGQQLPSEGLGITEKELTAQKPSSKPSPEPADEPSEEPEEELVKESEESPGEQEAPEEEDEEEPSEEPPVLPEEKPEADLEEYPEEDLEKDPDEDPKEEPEDEDENKDEDKNKEEDENKDKDKDENKNEDENKDKNDDKDEEKPNEKLPNEQPKEEIEKTYNGGDVEATTKFICMDIDELVPNSFMRCKVKGRLDSGWYYRVKGDSPPVTNIEPSLTFDDLME